MKDVLNFEDNYAVSKDGFVYSKKTKAPLKPSISNSGYQVVKLYLSGKPYNKNVHRLVAEAYCSGHKPTLNVNHIDGDKTNNSASNLEWVTKSQNMQHAYDTGLNYTTPMKGSKHGNAKLTEAKIIQIRRCLDQGISLSKTAKQFSVTKGTIWKISKNLNWRHV